jgi:hypothetical protein
MKSAQEMDESIELGLTNFCLCDRSPEWNRILARDREKIGLKIEDDGEFWY